MDLAKSYDFFNPETFKQTIHILGCGATGSTLAENLVRFGITSIELYDFDHVDSHNIANQMYRHSDIGKLKVEALKEQLVEINPECESIVLHPEGYTDQQLNGYVFLCVDNIDLRRKIATANKYNTNIVAMFDFRIRLTDAQAYAADWTKSKMIENFLRSMNFTQEEGLAEAPMSACNMMLSIVPPIRIIVGRAVANFINFVKGGILRYTMSVDTANDNFVLDAFE